MKLVEIKGNKLADGGEMTPNEKYTFEHYLKENIERDFKRRSYKELYEIIVNPTGYEAPAFFVTEMVADTIGYTTSYKEDDFEPILLYLERKYYDFCIDYLKKLATEKYGDKFSTLKSHKTPSPQSKKPFASLEHAYRRML